MLKLVIQNQNRVLEDDEVWKSSEILNFIDINVITVQLVEREHEKHINSSGTF